MFDNLINILSLLTLGAMKAHSLGRRSKWKDYVDLYFILNKYSLKKLVCQAKKIFKNEFNEKLFRVKLAYFKDIDFSEEVIFTSGFKKPKKEIKEFLKKISLS